MWPTLQRVGVLESGGVSVCLPLLRPRPRPKLLPVQPRVPTCSRPETLLKQLLSEWTPWNRQQVMQLQAIGPALTCWSQAGSYAPLFLLGSLSTQDESGQTKHKLQAGKKSQDKQKKRQRDRMVER